ncbi:MAG TPA: Rap1a/Tai family immunity protein [Xanthobacteraceae bacterium]|nr:Rap1a/Tai family immunity protein [Xanthobacteraceae bacterium]
MQVLLKLLAMTTVASVALADRANAQDQQIMMKGEDFLLACSKPDQDWIGFCHGYVQAVVDGVRMPGERFCAPTGTKRADIVGAVVDQLLKRPELRSLNAASVVYSVLIRTYPCR